MNKNKVDFETAVIDYLSPRGYARRERLIEYLIKSHPGETGYSEPSINRKLTSMHKAGSILIEKDSEFLAQYEIEKEAGNASYVLAKNALEIMKHLNYVFGKYRTGDIITKKTALKEIKRYNITSFFSPSHVDILVLDLDNEDASLVDSLLEILYNQIINKGNKPGNKEIFLEKLRTVLKKYQQGHNKYSMLRHRVICLLGYYNDKAVLEQLKADIEAGRLSETKGDYWDWFTARVIEEGRTELFDLEIIMRKEENTETADILAEIRDQALAKAKKPIEPDLPWEAAIGISPGDKKLLPVIKSSEVFR